MIFYIFRNTRFIYNVIFYSFIYFEIWDFNVESFHFLDELFSQFQANFEIIVVIPKFSASQAQRIWKYALHVYYDVTNNTTFHIFQ